MEAHAIVATAEDYREALGYEAPFLIDKIIEEGIAETRAEAEALFLEVKRYIVLSHATGARLEIFSHHVDEVWHNFVLYTHEYATWCRRHFGRYMHHAPSNAPKFPVAEAREADTRSPREFPDQYRAFYGFDLASAWYDERNVTLSMRAIASMKDLALRIDPDEVHIITPTGRQLFGVNLLALAALQFIATGKPFFVRELPGDLDDDEKVGLVSTLVARRLARVY